MQTANAINLSTTVTATQGNLCCEVGGEAVILNLESGIYFGLDPVGARIWQIVQQPTLLSDVKAALLDEYEVEAVQCERDLLEFTETLADKNLLEVKT